MGFLVTLIYVVLHHLSPAEIFPSLVDSRLMLWLTIAAIVATVPSIATGRFPFRAPQVWLMLGLTAAIPVSRLAHLWLGGMFPALELFLPAGVVFFLIVANVTTLHRLRILMIAFLATCLFLLFVSVAAYHSGDLDSPFVLQQNIGDPTTGEISSTLSRIRGPGLLNDPNDFAQCLLTALPFLGLAWRSGRKLRNTLLVILPASFILYGIYLTRSRGAVIGFGVILLALFANRFGKTRSAIASAAIVALMLAPVAALRGTSVTDSSRLIEWGSGIAMLKSSPLFGVGFGSFLANSELTAHNSFVLCFAELGLVGYFFWLGLIVYNITDLNAAIRTLGTGEENEEWLRYARVLRSSLFAFLATAWFLSRTYTVTLYMILGMVVAFIQILKNEQTHESDNPAQSRWKLTAAFEMASVAVVYAFIRLGSL
jgi:putative inorganic carbon (HCO3(-)) transporter